MKIREKQTEKDKKEKREKIYVKGGGEAKKEDKKRGSEEKR